ncbi:hypothetical protein QFC24_006286 [Naganishia onofrii]|uniref:Uncharacterized protein n=1 Tax=Naganishia onofrii TaxID=1851511 RepID=A0ACC2X1T4_9TREE|nr:hypothetical protein QFC24_006286 [Naganishia onofrii]
MLAGNPNQKTPNGIFVYECHPNADGSGAIAGDSFNFDDLCAFGVKFDLTFPSCWDGINLYKNDNSHVNYPTNSIRDGPCPATHPIRLPSILLEYTYHPESFPAITKGQKLKGRLAWANGDTTGYGLHADFLNGWDTAILTKALNDPGCVNIGYSIEIQKCPVLSPYFNTATAQACKPARGQLQEPYAQGDGNVLPRLPGCNLLWGSSGPKPTCDPPVAGLDVSAFTTTDGPYVLAVSEQRNVTVSQDKGWHNIGCYMGTSAVQPLGPGITYTDPSMTPERCQQSCAKNSYTYSALSVVGGFTCTCSNTFNSGSAPVYSGCDTACPIGSSTCGGQYKQDIFYQAAQWVGQDPKAYDLGCYALPQDWQNTGLVKASTYSFTSNSLTREVCAQACVQKGAKWAAERDTSCYCGTNFDMASGMFGGQSLPDSQCSTPCAGNPANSTTPQYCGAPYTLSLYNSSAAIYGAAQAIAAHPSGWQGCFGSALIANKVAYSNYTIYPAVLTVASCQSTCAYFGYQYAALWAGASCNCGNQLVTTGRQPDTYCNSPCKTTPNVTCGGGGSIDVYAVNSTQAPDTSALKAQGWLGCYANPSSGTALSDYSFMDNAMTPQLCQTGCRQVGDYKLSGVQGSVCNCGNINKGVVQPPSSCQTNCPGTGAAGQSCGGTYASSIYNTTTANSTSTVVVSGKGSGWTGCYKEAVGTRALSAYTYSLNAMTTTLCKKACSLRGYSVAGLEYAVQ